VCITYTRRARLLSFASWVKKLCVPYLYSYSIAGHRTRNPFVSCLAYCLPSLEFHSTINSPSLNHHITTIVPSHHHHSTITSPSHHHHITITLPSHYHHITITSPSHHHHSTITSPSHHHHLTITSPSHQHHFTITVPSQYHQFAITCVSLLLHTGVATEGGEKARSSHTTTCHWAAGAAQTLPPGVCNTAGYTVKLTHVPAHQLNTVPAF